MSFVLLEFRELFTLRPYGPEQKTEEKYLNRSLSLIQLWIRLLAT